MTIPRVLALALLMAALLSSCAGSPSEDGAKSGDAQSSSSTEPAGPRERARAFLARGSGVRAVAAMAELGPARKLEQADKAVFIQALAAAGEELVAAGDVPGAQSYWAEWADLDPNAEEPRAMIAATSEKGNPFKALKRTVLVLAEPLAVPEKSPEHYGAAPSEAAPAPSSPAPAPMDVPSDAVEQDVLPEQAAASKSTVGADQPVASTSSKTALAPIKSTRKAPPVQAPVEVKKEPLGEKKPLPPAPTVEISLDQIAELIRKKRFELAEVMARRYLSTRVPTPTALNLLGITLMQQEKKKEAADVFRESLKLKPQQPEVKMAIDDLESALANE